MRLRAILLLACGALVAGGAVLGLAAPAQAHNYLVESTPSAGEVLTSLPQDFSITTNDVLLDIRGNGSGFAIQVKDQDGLFYGDGCVSVDGAAMSTAAALGAPGKYEVIWQAISTDGHTVSNDFSFTWKPSSADAAVSQGAKSATDCHGTQSTGATKAEPGSGDSPATADNGEALGAVLWIGGAALAVGLAVVLTLLLTSRKKKPE